MARTRLGKGSISFTVDATEYNLDVTSVVLDSEEADGGLVTFADAAAGGSFQYFLEISAVQSLDAASLHTFIWDNPGVEAAFVFAPKGATERRWTGTVKVPGGGAPVGGEANAEWSFDKRFDLVGEPTVVAATV